MQHVHILEIKQIQAVPSARLVNPVHHEVPGLWEALLQEQGKKSTQWQDDTAKEFLMEAQ